MDAVTDTDAEEAVAQAERFLDVVLTTFKPDEAGENDGDSD